jgi:hypothetical protein
MEERAISRKETSLRDRCKQVVYGSSICAAHMVQRLWAFLVVYTSCTLAD